MRNFGGTWPILAQLGVLAAALLVIAGLVSLDRAQWILPTPEGVADSFMEALAAHRYTGAMGALSQDLAGQVTEADLQALVEQIEARHAGIRSAQEQDSQETGDTAAAAVLVELGDLSEQELEFPLQKENGLWKLTSLEPARQLAEGE